MLFHIDALTGEESTGASSFDNVLKGIDIIAGPMVEAYLVRDESTKFVLLFDEFLQVGSPYNHHTLNLNNSRYTSGSCLPRYSSKC